MLAPASIPLVLPPPRSAIGMRPDQFRKREHRDGVTTWLPMRRETAPWAPSTGLAPNEGLCGPHLQLLRSPERPEDLVTDARTSIPTPAHHFPHRSQQNLEVHPETPAADILQIQIHSSLERWIPSCCNLPKSGDSGCHVQPRQMFNGVGCEIVQRMWARTDQAHFAL